MVTNIPTPRYTTVWRTSLITVHLPRTNTSHVPSSIVYPPPTQFPTSLDPQSTSDGPISLPPIVTESPSAIMSSFTNTGSAGPTSSSTATATEHGTDRKQAIVGGLSGAIAGLILIGVIIAFLLRRRRDESNHVDSTNEKGLKRTIARKWTSLTPRRPLQTPPTAVTRGSTTTLDGGLIHVDLNNWPRPFLQDESFRESMGPGKLRIMNPSPSSRPTTRASTITTPNNNNNPTTTITLSPRRSNESMRQYITRQKTAIAASKYLEANRSQQSATCNLSTPSFRSYPSVSLFEQQQQRPPEDPFLAPLDEEEPADEEPLRRRPRLAAKLGNALNPFRSPRTTTTTMNAEKSAPPPPRLSLPASLSSSNGDPWMLDREMRASPRLEVYPGT